MELRAVYTLDKKRRQILDHIKIGGRTTVIERYMKKGSRHEVEFYYIRELNDSVGFAMTEKEKDDYLKTLY
jgi:predicted transcriptional regulator